MQNKRRKYSQDEEPPKEEAPDPLSNATTLYVGNLCDIHSFKFCYELLLTFG